MTRPSGLIPYQLQKSKTSSASFQPCTPKASPIAYFNPVPEVSNSRWNTFRSYSRGVSRLLTVQVTKKVRSGTSGRSRGSWRYGSDDEASSEGGEKIDGKSICFAASCHEASLAPLTCVSPSTSVAIALKVNLLRAGEAAVGGTGSMVPRLELKSATPKILITFCGDGHPDQPIKYAVNQLLDLNVF